MLKKNIATERIKRQIEHIDGVSHVGLDSSDFTKWHRDTEIAIQNIFGANTRHLSDFRGIDYSPMVYSGGMSESYLDARFRDGLEKARAVLLSLVQEIEEYWEDEPAVGRGPDPIQRIERMFNRFHLVARRLRARHSARSTLEIEDEYDVQDLLHAMLLLDFDDVRPEEWTPSYAGGSGRMDFLLKNEGLVIEVKKTRKGLETREVGDQLLIDIGRYQCHPDCSLLLCFVYDPEGRIGNPRGLENDLSKVHDKVQVKVVVAPRGL